MDFKAIPKTFQILILIIISTNVLSTLKEARKFTTVINPGCPSQLRNCSNMTLLHIKSDGENDSYHFLWSFIKSPTLLMARTSLNSTLSIEWMRLLESKNASIIFQPEPFYTFGWSMVKVWVADDTNDVVLLDKMNQSTIIGYETKNFVWEMLSNQSYKNSTHVQISLIAKHYFDKERKPEKRDLGPNGYVKMTIRMKSSEDYSHVLPYMLYSENSTQVDIAFNEVQLNISESDYPKSPRIGFNYILVQGEHYKNGSERMRLDRSKSLDDEYTPGVFETLTIRTPVINGTDQSFIQWKPICYTAEVRDVSDSVDVIPYELKDASYVKRDDLEESILWSYYGQNIDDMLVEATNISFGTEKDGFYTKTKHISWTYSTGFGEPPKDFVSIMVFLIVGIGLGIPAIIITFSLVYVLIRRMRKASNEYLLGR